MPRARWILVSLFVLACGDDTSGVGVDAEASDGPRPDGPIDAALDASVDAAIDAPSDASVDAPIDAAMADRPAPIDAFGGDAGPGGELACGRSMGWTAGAVAADDDGTVLVAGYYGGPATFGAGEPAETTLSATAGLFVARYRSDCTLVWVRSVDGAENGADGNNDGLGITVRGGIIYVAGSFVGSVTFGPGETNQTALTTTSGDGFLARYAADGSLIWVRRASGTGGVQATGVAVSPTDGSVYISGWVHDGQATFGAGEPGEATVGSPPTPPYIVRTLYVARYRSDGSFVRVRSAGGAVMNDAAAWAVAATADGGVLAAGDFHGTVTFGTGDPNQTTLTSPSMDALILRYNEDGSLAWAKHAGGSGEARAFGVAASADTIRWVGHFGAMGGLGGSATFGTGESGQVTLNAVNGDSDIFVAALHGDGTLAWARRAGGGGFDIAFAVALDSAGSAVVAGTYGGPLGAFATFGPGEPGQTVLPGGNSYEIFVARYDANGMLMWARKGAGPTSYDEAYGVAISPDESVTAVGRFGDSVIFDPGQQDAIMLTAPPDFGAAFMTRFVQ